MPVVIIRENERLRWEDKETNTYLIYRRPSGAKQRELQAKHTENGIIDRDEYLEELIEWSVLDWGIIDPEEPGGFVDDRGNKIDYEKGATRGLPDPYLTRFYLNLHAVDPVGADLGN